MKPKRMTGVWSAVLTPVDADFAPDARAAVEYYRDLLQTRLRWYQPARHDRRGDVVRRRAAVRFMEAVAASGLPMERVMCGTGATRRSTTRRA